MYLLHCKNIIWEIYQGWCYIALNKRQGRFIKMNKLKNKNVYKFYGYIFIVISILMVYISYIKMLLPPQMGWWNYYGWRIASGDVLYQDLYCFMPPYVPLLQAFLYRFLGNDMFLFQLLGIGLIIIISLITYRILLERNNALMVSISVLTGTCISAGFLPHIPFDYHTIMLLDITIIAYSAAHIDKNNYLYTALMGAALGISFMIKQTMVMLAFILLVLFIVYVMRVSKVPYKILIKHGLIMFFAMIFSVLPALYYLYSNNVLWIALDQIMKASAAKGYSSGFIYSVWNVIQRYITYGLSLPNITIAMCLFLRYFIKCDKYSAYFNLILLNVIVFKFMRIILCSFYFDVSLASYLIVAALVFGMINYVFFYKHANTIVCKRNVNIIWFILIVVLILEFWIVFFAPQILVDFFDMGNGNFFFLVRRSFSEIAFYFCLFIIFFKLYKKNECNNSLSYWFVVTMCMFQSLIFMGSGSLDEGYSLPTVAFLLTVVLNKEDVKIHYFIYVISILLITSLIANKQAVPYSWHGWTSVGMKEHNVKFIDSNIETLNGYKLDRDTELAYENIVEAINIYSNSDDTVYEFPHAPLFNCLTERKLGSFAVSHFVDVCPDEVLRDDIARLKANPPKMFIYVKLHESAWRGNENYFRAGKYSARKDMEHFYDTYIKNNYKCIYNYKNIYVWTREDSMQQNMKFGLALLQNYSKCYNNDDLKQYLQNVNIEELYNKNLDKNSSVDTCIAKILKDNICNFMKYEGVSQVYSVARRQYGMPLVNSSTYEQNETK